MNEGQMLKLTLPYAVVGMWLMCLNTRSPAASTVWEGCGTFRRWSLAEGSDSLQQALRFLSLVPLPVHPLFPDYKDSVLISHPPCPLLLSFHVVNQNKPCLSETVSCQVCGYSHGQCNECTKQSLEQSDTWSR